MYVTLSASVDNLCMLSKLSVVKVCVSMHYKTHTEQQCWPSCSTPLQPGGGLLPLPTNSAPRHWSVEVLGSACMAMAIPLPLNSLKTSTKVCSRASCTINIMSCNDDAWQV